MSNGGTPIRPQGPDASPSILVSLTPAAVESLRQLARRYHVRADTTLRPPADVLYDLRSRHGLASI